MTEAHNQAPRDIPILFSGPMVLALLREVEQPGTGKTTTRRMAWLPPRKPSTGKIADSYQRRSPWQDVNAGDRLWVRETVACGACAKGSPSTWSPSFWRREQGTPANPNGLWYAADNLAPADPITDKGKWVPGIHMPKWASRLTLIVTGSKIEPLHQISRADVLAEGVSVEVIQKRERWLLEDKDRRREIRKKNYSISAARNISELGAKQAFGELWASINGQDSWDSNPEVIAISFRVVARNIFYLSEAA